MEILGFTDREMRDSKWRELRTLGHKGICRYSTHDDGTRRIIYVVAWSTPKPTTVVEPEEK